MKPYIDFLFEKKSYYKKNGDIGMSNTFKILANSLFGVMMTRCEKFKDFKIVTTESQVDKQIKKPNFSCRNIINENLTILEMEKTSVIYNYPILIGSIILQNSVKFICLIIYIKFIQIYLVIIKYYIKILIVFMLN